MSDIYFNSKKMPKPKNEYVAYVDIMGTKSHMQHSVHETANFIFKLHAAILSAWRSEKYKNVFVYPVMDGAYVTASNQEDMEKILVRLYDSLAQLFMKETNNSNCFVIQTGLAFGKVIHGHNVPYNASKIYELDLSYKNNILLGQAMIDAYEIGQKSAPFGIELSDSSIKHDVKVGEYGAFGKDWKWYLSKKIKIKSDYTELGNKLLSYFEKFKDEANPLHYEIEKINEHINRIKDYFSSEVA